jgi:hypothetical protein
LYSAGVIRWLRLVATSTVVLTMIGLGVITGLFLVANSGWIAIDIPPWLTGIFGEKQHEVWLPALIAGWLLSVLLVGVVFLWSVYYVWRRRQYEALISKLERELANLRNLPFKEPAPLEDVPEKPDIAAARVLAQIDADDELGGLPR